MAHPRLRWDFGTAYDMFVSLAVLHRPADFGVRGTWSAGVRARLPAAERELLEQSHLLIWIPLHWIHTLPEQKDGATVLWTLGQMPPVERLPALSLTPETPRDMADTLREVAARGAWDEKALQEVARQRCDHEKGKKPRISPKEMSKALEWWARPAEFGERYLEVLRAYQEGFFAEEEQRIRPALQAALERAQELAQRLALPDLLEEISQGLRLKEVPGVAELTLAPSYWCTPLVVFEFDTANKAAIWLFGARPADASLVPGEAVPDALIRALSALADPTRLRILRYLTEEPLAPTQLARRLRLRAPTVTHHLGILRLAGLVQLTLDMDEEGEKEVRRYAARAEGIGAACDALRDFLGGAESTKD
jgi:DNA-binding transcriptional ArsR family regulator